MRLLAMHNLTTHQRVSQLNPPPVNSIKWSTWKHLAKTESFKTRTCTLNRPFSTCGRPDKCSYLGIWRKPYSSNLCYIVILLSLFFVQLCAHCVQIFSHTTTWFLDSQNIRRCWLNRITESEIRTILSLTCNCTILLKAGGAWHRGAIMCVSFCILAEE